MDQYKTSEFDQKACQIIYQNSILFLFQLYWLFKNSTFPELHSVVVNLNVTLNFITLIGRPIATAIFVGLLHLPPKFSVTVTFTTTGTEFGNCTNSKNKLSKMLIKIRTFLMNYVSGFSRRKLCMT